MIGETIRALSSPLLATKRLLLRPFREEDALSLFNWASDREVTRYLRFTTLTELYEAKRVIAYWLEEAKKPPFFHWAITERISGVVFGSIGIDVLNMHDRRGEVGYCLAKTMWNQGYATEALRAVVSFGFVDAGFHRIEGCHAVDNPASGRVMEKAGMWCEAGPLRHYYRADLLGYQDVMMYVAFSDTWNKQ